MEQLAAFVFTNSSVAEIRTFKHVTLMAIRSLDAEPSESKGSANRGVGRGCRVSIWAVNLGTVAFGVVQAIRHSLGAEVMGQIAKLAVGTLAIFEEVFADCNFVWVVGISTRGALRA